MATDEHYTMKMNKLQFLFLLLSSLGAISYAQLPTTIHPDTLELRINKVENSLSPLVLNKGESLWNLEAQMKKYSVSGLSLAVINDYQIEWAKGYGSTSNPENLEVSKQTVFQAASISKFVNAVALLKLKEQGSISFDEDINRLLTSWKFSYDQNISEEPITLRHLLSHTAGLSTHGFEGYLNSKKLPTIVQTLSGEKPANSKRVQPLVPPNNTFKYSGGGTTISQLILMDNSDASYENFLELQVFQPLGMNNSFYAIEFEKYPKHMAFGHSKKGVTLRNNYNLYPESAAAGLWTNPTDLSKLIVDIQKSLAEKKGITLTKASCEEMITPVLQNEISALGLFVEDQNGTKYVQHSGSNRGFRAKLYFGTTNGKGVVIMVNGTNTKIIEELLRSVAAVYSWSGFKKLQSSIQSKPTESDLRTYLGTYVSNTRNVIVSLKKGNLVITEKGKWSSSLTFLGNAKFVANDIQPQAVLAFINDSDSILEKLIVQQGKTTLEWIKTE